MIGCCIFSMQHPFQQNNQNLTHSTIPRHCISLTFDYYDGHDPDYTLTPPLYHPGLDPGSMFTFSINQITHTNCLHNQRHYAEK